MSDLGDEYRAMKEHRREQRRKHGRPCNGCTIREPKREPKILFPGQRCTYCGHRDERKRRR